MEENKEKFVKITLKEYIQLLTDSERLNYLECCGVDNWDPGISFKEYLEEQGIEAFSKKEEDYKNIIIN